MVEPFELELELEPWAFVSLLSGSSELAVSDSS